MNITVNDLWDQKVTPSSINNLNSAIIDKVIQFIYLAQNSGIFLRVPTNGGYISFETQKFEYERGNFKVLPGHTYHNYGLAFDVLPLKREIFTLDPRPSDGLRTLTDDDWKKVGNIGKSLGFEWGGEWIDDNKPHPKFDSAHFQIPRTLITIEDLLALREQQKTDKVILPEEIITSFND